MIFSSGSDVEVPEPRLRGVEGSVKSFLRTKIFWGKIFRIPSYDMHFRFTHKLEAGNTGILLLSRTHWHSSFPHSQKRRDYFVGIGEWKLQNRYTERVCGTLIRNIQPL